MKKHLLLITFFFSVAFMCGGQDIRGGEILSSHVSGYKYSFDIYLYTKTSLGINHSTLLISTGDNAVDTLNGASTVLANDITEWHYSHQHTYTGSGNFNIQISDSFRVGGIQNISNSSAEGIILSHLMLIYPQFFGPNNSPVLNNNQSYLTMAGGNILHNPNAFDSDGDSLVFSLIPASASSYSFPPGATIDSKSGLFQMPLSNNVYSVAIKIDEWRLGTLIGSVVREMLIDSTIITNVHDVEINDEAVKIYPNPVSDKLYIQSKNELKNIKIIDMFGKCVLETNGSRFLWINTNYLPRGIYTLEILDISNQKFFRKLIIN